MLESFGNVLYIPCILYSLARHLSDTFPDAFLLRSCALSGGLWFLCVRATSGGVTDYPHMRANLQHKDSDCNRKGSPLNSMILLNSSQIK